MVEAFAILVWTLKVYGTTGGLLQEEFCNDLNPFLQILFPCRTLKFIQNRLEVVSKFEMKCNI